MNYLVVSQYDWICREKSGLDTKNLKELEKMISSNKEKRKRRRVKKAVAKRQQLENKKEKIETNDERVKLLVNYSKLFENAMLKLRFPGIIINNVLT